MADKYLLLSPYNYCLWNPVDLVDPDGNVAIDNDDWYKNGKGEVRWFNSTDKTYTHEGEEYQRVGKTSCMTNSSGEFVYGDQYGHTHESAPLKEVSITENLTDFERTMRNPLVQSIHQSAAVFWGHPVTEAVVDATLFVVTGGIEAVVKGAGKAIVKQKAKSLSVRQSSSNVSTTDSLIKDWLGEGRCKINKHGDPIFTSKDNLRNFESI